MNSRFRTWRLRAEAAFFRREWNIGLLSVSSLQPGNRAVGRVDQWFAAQGRPYLAADPFLINEDGQCWILAEVKTSPSAKGAIAAWRLSDGGVKYHGIVIAERGVHLSYPFVFRWRGAIYCVPERAEAGSPIIYQAKQLPDQWDPASSQMPAGPLVDPTVFEHNGHWWLAATDALAGPQTHLSLWYGTSPLGPWEPHRGNPVKRDISCSRPAGTPFYHGGNLYRPAQDNSRGYGGRVVFNRVIELTPESFHEEPEGSLEPDVAGAYPRGLHTVCVSGKIVLVDGLRVRPHLLAPLNFLRAVARNRRIQKHGVETA